MIGPLYCFTAKMEKKKTGAESPWEVCKTGVLFLAFFQFWIFYNKKRVIFNCALQSPLCFVAKKIPLLYWTGVCC